MNVMDIIAGILRKEGVSLLFAYPDNPLIDAAAALGIRPIICRQERVSGDAARGHVRVTDGDPPATLAVQWGPGAEHAFATVAAAHSESAPVLVIPLGHPRDRSQVTPLFRPGPSFAPVTKHCEELLVPEEIVNVMRRAFGALRNGRRGPVLVGIPTDVAAADVSASALDAYTPVRAVRAAPDPLLIDEAAELLAQARRPVIYAGQGVFYARACDALRAVAETVGAPVLTTVEAKSAFPETHPLALGAGAGSMPLAVQHFLGNADVVLAVGTSLTRYPMHPPIPSGIRIIHASADADDLYKDQAPEIPIVGDAALTLQALLDALVARIHDSRDRKVASAAEIATVRSRWDATWRRRLQSRSSPINPYRVVAEFMRQVAADDAIVTHDSGSVREQLVSFYRAGGPHSYLGWGRSHGLGSGMGLILGAKLARPEKVCVNFMGDAAFGYSGVDFETAVRLGIPILTIVLNNGAMACCTTSLSESHARYGTRAVGGNYAAIARELGGYGARVDAPDDISAAITSARHATEDGTPALIEFMVSEETALPALSAGLAHATTT